MSTKLTKPTAQPTLSDATEMIWHKTSIRVYPITESQLDELIAGYNSLSLVFFGVCFGAALTLGTVCRQAATNAPEEPYYVVGCAAALLLAVFFGVHGVGSYEKPPRRQKSSTRSQAR
jgi:hypothetical protein